MKTEFKVRPMFLLGALPRIWEGDHFKIVSHEEGGRSVVTLLKELNKSRKVNITLLKEKVFWNEKDFDLDYEDPADAYILFVMGFFHSPKLIVLAEKPTILFEGDMIPLRALEKLECLYDKGEVELAPSFKDVDNLLRVFKARKDLANTRLGIFGLDAVPRNLQILFPDINQPLRRAFNIKDVEVKSSEIKEIYDGIDNKEASAIIDKWLREDIEVEMPKEDLINTTRLYITFKKIIEKKRINALSIECGALASKGLPWPCFVVSRLNDEGIVSTCVGDSPCAIMLSYLANKPVFFGGPYLFNEGTLFLSHCTAPSRMKGFFLRPSVVTLRHGSYHINHEAITPYAFIETGDVVTIACLSREGGVLVTKGKIVSSRCGDEEKNCRNLIGVHVSNPREFIIQSYSHLYSLVYGDYVNEVERLCALLDAKVKRI